MPARARDHITTEALLAVTGSTRDIRYQWVALKLLPRPWLATAPDSSQLAAAWAPEALARVRFIVARQRQGVPMEDIAARLEARFPRR